MKTAKQLADLRDDDLAKELEGYLLGLNLLGPMERREPRNICVKKFDSLMEKMEGLAALIQGAEMGGSSGALDADVAD